MSLNRPVPLYFFSLSFNINLIFSLATLDIDIETVLFLPDDGRSHSDQEIPKGSYKILDLFRKRPVLWLKGSY